MNILGRIWEINEQIKHIQTNLRGHDKKVKKFWNQIIADLHEEERYLCELGIFKPYNKGVMKLVRTYFLSIDKENKRIE